MDGTTISRLTAKEAEAIVQYRDRRRVPRLGRPAGHLRPQRQKIEAANDKIGF